MNLYFHDVVASPQSDVAGETDAQLLQLWPSSSNAEDQVEATGRSCSTWKIEFEYKRVLRPNCSSAGVCGADPKGRAVRASTNSRLLFSFTGSPAAAASAAATVASDSVHLCLNSDPLRIRCRSSYFARSGGSQSEEGSVFKLA